MRRIVICDTGPLLHLSEAKVLYLLRLAGEVSIPPMIAKEFEQNVPEIGLPDWVQIQNLDATYSRKALEWAKQIDAGESAAIALTLQTQADWLLSDDAKARQFAESFGLEVHGSVGLLLWGVASGQVASQDEALHRLNALASSSLWISDRVLCQARAAIDKLFSA